MVGGKPNQRGVVSAASYAARKFGVHSAMPLRTAYKLCPQAIFVEGHPERYREYSEKGIRRSEPFSPRSRWRRSMRLSRSDRHGAAAWAPLRAAHLLHEAVKARNQSELLARHRIIAAGREGCVRSGEAERHSLDSPGQGRRDFWLRSTSARFPASAR